MVNQIREQFIYKTAKIGKQWGIGESAGKVWGVLMFSEKSLTQKEICKQSGYSIGLISRSITILESLRMVSDVGRKDKEKLYSASATATDFLGKLMVNLLENNIKPIISLLDTNREQVNDNKIKLRMNILIKDYSKIRESLNNFSSFLIKENR